MQQPRDHGPVSPADRDDHDWTVIPDWDVHRLEVEREIHTAREPWAYGIEIGPCDDLTPRMPGPGPGLNQMAGMAAIALVIVMAVAVAALLARWGMVGAHGPG